MTRARRGQPLVCACIFGSLAAFLPALIYIATSSDHLLGILKKDLRLLPYVPRVSRREDGVHAVCSDTRACLLPAPTRGCADGNTADQIDGVVQLHATLGTYGTSAECFVPAVNAANAMVGYVLPRKCCWCMKIMCIERFRELECIVMICYSICCHSN
jgi:hypothetical protein